MGLLDNLPEALTSDQGLLGLALMASGAPRAGGRTSLGEGLLGAAQMVAAQKRAREEAAMKARMQDLQEQQIRGLLASRQDQMQERQAAREQQKLDAGLLRGMFTPMEGPTQDQQPLMPRFDPASMAGRGASLPAVFDAMKLNAAMNPQPEAYTLRPGEQRFVGGKPVASVPDKPADLPSAVREWQFGQDNPAFLDYQLQQRRAGATNIGLPKIDIKMGEGIAGQVGPMLKSSREQAEAGLRLVDSASRVLSAAEAGNLYAGPMANLRLKAAQAADVLGIAGKDTQEKIANTRSTVRGMAEQAVSARAQLGGQAQISNSEQELLNRATSGDITDLTVSEVAQIARLNDRLGRMMHANHARNMDTMRQRPELSNVAPFYEVPGLPAARENKAPAVKRRISTDAEYMSLPSGTEFIAPDGSVRRKP